MEAENSRYTLLQNIFRRRGRIAELATGYSVNWLLAIGFDYLLYPYVIFMLGVVRGGIIMGTLSGLACLLMIRFYDWSRRDWLGIETIKGMKDYQGDSKFGKFTARILQRSDPVAILFLSIKFDPFITMVYLRRDSHQYNGMSARDWRIFLSSVAISNIYWTLAAYMGISVVEWVWKVVMKG